MTPTAIPELQFMFFIITCDMLANYEFILEFKYKISSMDNLSAFIITYLQLLKSENCVCFIYFHQIFL